MAVKDKKGKPRVDLVHYDLIKAIAEVREFGIKKYVNDEDWKKAEIKDYVAAAIRHLYKYLWEGELDDESGLPHLSHAATSMDLAITLTNIKKNEDVIIPTREIFGILTDEEIEQAYREAYDSDPYRGC